MQHDNDNNQISFVSMFSGIEAASVAFGPLGWRAICFAEIEKFPSAVLAHHYPNTPNVGDMSAHDWSQYAGKADIVCGGPPCQAFSVAGLRQSLGDVRGNLSLVYMKALHAIKPRNAIIENVPGWLSTKDNAFGCFLAGLVGATDALPPPKGRRWPNAGMVAGPKGRAAWRVLDAQYFGLAQRRKRVIVVADFGNGADPAAVLFEPESVRRDSPPSRETGQGIAPTISARTKGGGGLGTDFDLDGGLITKQWPAEIASTLDTTFGPKMGQDNQHVNAGCPLFVPGPVHAIQAGALKAEGADASEDGTGRGTPIIAFQSNQSFDSGNNVDVAPTLRIGSGGQGQPPAICFSAKDYGADASIDLAPTLRAGGHTTSHANAGVMPAIAYGFQPRIARNGRGDMGDVVSALNAQSGETGKGDAAPCVAIAFTTEQTPKFNEECALTLTKQSPTGGGQIQSVTYASAVRRLTPRECERLQGFPDDYTAIPWRGKPAELCPDGPRYKALGNSWAVPLFTWLGERIQRLMPPIAANDNNKESINAAA